jgi:hypothetical protein
LSYRKAKILGVKVIQNFVITAKVAALQKCPHRRRKDDQLRDKMSQGWNSKVFFIRK